MKNTTVTNNFVQWMFPDSPALTLRDWVSDPEATRVDNEAAETIVRAWIGTHLPVGYSLVGETLLADEAAVGLASEDWKAFHESQGEKLSMADVNRFTDAEWDGFREELGLLDVWDKTLGGYPLQPSVKLTTARTYRATMMNSLGSVLFVVEGNIAFRDEMVWLFNDAVAFRGGDTIAPLTGAVSQFVSWTRDGDTEVLVADVPGVLQMTLRIEGVDTGKAAR